MTAKEKWLSDDLFLLFRSGAAVVWDYKNHKQFEITDAEFVRLKEFSAGEILTNSLQDQLFDKAGLLSDLTSTENGWGWDVLSKIFHVGTSHPNPPTADDPTKHIEYAKGYLDFCKSIEGDIPNLVNTKGTTRTLLPAPDYSVIKDSNLWESLLARRTCRDFFDTPVSLNDFSLLLKGTLGTIEAPDYDAPLGVQRFGFRRTSPSAGGLQATEGYVWVRNVTGIDPGIYYYASGSHYLELVAELPSEPISTYLCGQHWANNLGFSLFFTANFDRLWWKYPHSRAYRPMLMDIGHLSQTFNLLATALGLQTWLTGYFHDREINELLKLQQPNEQTLFLVGAGHGSGSSYDPVVRKILDEN